MTNKILLDPRQRRFFKSNSLQDLFMLGHKDEGATETSELFEDVTVQGPNPSKPKRTQKSRRKHDDLESIENLDSFQPLLDGKADDGKIGATLPDENDRILQSLFSSTGVHSAIQHDDIMSASRPETLLVDKEASRVANDAVMALKKSRQRIRAHGIGQPTWTGKSGTVGAPSRFGSGSSLQPQLSGSASILSKLKRMSSNVPQLDKTPLISIKELGNPTLGSQLALPTLESNPTLHENMAESMRVFLKSQDGCSAPTSKIVSHFKMGVTPSDVSVFRKMLRAIATFQKESGSWKLNDDFL